MNELFFQMLKKAHSLTFSLKGLKLLGILFEALGWQGKNVKLY